MIDLILIYKTEYEPWTCIEQSKRNLIIKTFINRTISWTVKDWVWIVIPELYVPSPSIQWTKALQVNKS